RARVEKHGYGITAFITMEGQERVERIIEASYEATNHYESKVPVIIIAATYNDLMQKGPWDEIWKVNNGYEGLYKLSEIAPLRMNEDEEPILIGSPYWREYIRTDESYQTLNF